MKCFNHSEQDGVAVCRHCGKALCRECLVETPQGIACHGRCETQVGAISELLQRADRDARTYRGLGILLVVLAIMMSIFALWLPGLERELFDKPIGLGRLAFVVFGLVAVAFAGGVICYRHGSPTYRP